MFPVFVFVTFNFTGVRSDTIRDTILQYANKETWETSENQRENWNDDLPPLHLAVYLNKYEACEHFIQSGAYLDAVDEFGASALLYATSANNLKIVNLLLESGINVNLRDDLGRAALHIAAKHGFVEIFKALLFDGHKRIKVKITDNDGRSAFHYAALGDHAEIIHILSFTEARTNQPDIRSNMTPLQFAIVEGKKNAAHALVHVASDMIKDNGSEELRLAAQHGRKLVLLSLLDYGFSLKGKDNKGNTVLLNAVDYEKKETFDEHLAACESRAEIVRALILMGADLNVVNKDEKSAADIALEGGNYAAYSVIKMEMEIRGSRKGAKKYLPPLLYEMTESYPDMEKIRRLISVKNIDETDHLGRSAIHMAVVADNLALVKELISAGCDITLKEGLGNTVLHSAKSVEMAETLLKANKNLANIANDRGYLPLLTAVHKCRKEVVEILAPSTSEIGAVNNRFSSALDMATSEIENYDIVKILVKHGAGDNRNINPEIRSPLHMSAIGGNVKMTEFLLENGLDNTVRNMGGTLPVVCAIILGNVNVIRILIKGVEPDTTNMYGFSLLHHAAEWGREEVLKMLVEEYGVPLNLLTNNGKTALMMAARRGYVGIVKALVGYGTDVTLATPYGKTALFYALWHVYMNCVPILSHASRDTIYFKNSKGKSPIDIIFTYALGDKIQNNKLAIVDWELSPVNVPNGELKRVLGFLSETFDKFLNELWTPISFKEYVKRGMEDFKKDNGLDEHSMVEDYVTQGFGIFYASVAAYYPELAHLEMFVEDTELLNKKQIKYQNAVAAFEKDKNKMMYMKELRYILVESLMRKKGRQRFVGTYMDSIAQELVDDTLVGVTNNESVWERMELVANSLMLTCKNREELSSLKGFLGGKMARLAEVIIPKYKFKI